MDDLDFEITGPQTMFDAAEHQLNQASLAVRDLAADIGAFEAELTDGVEMQVVIIGGPGGMQMFPHSLEPLGADRIRYKGLDQAGNRVTVVQHVTQLNVMLQAVAVAPLIARRTTFRVVEVTAG